MSTGDYLNIHPSQLKFPFELKMQSSCSLQLTNITDQNIAFKVKTTDPKKYAVRPNNGIVLPGSVCILTVKMQAQKEAPPGMQCKDKFLVQSIVAPSGKTTDIISYMFNKEERVVREFKLEVVYVPAYPPSNAPKESEEGSSTMVEPGSQSSSRPDGRGIGLHYGEYGSMSTGDFLNVHPSELKFPFELKKQISCSLQLTNITDQNIAFTVKTTNPKKYCVRPKSGIVLPRSVCNVTVTMQAQKETPPDMHCKDKFLVQSVVAPNGATVKDITADTFNKEDNKVVKEFKLRSVYLLDNPYLPVLDEYEEVPSTMAEHGSQSSSRPHVARRSREPKVKFSKEALQRKEAVKIRSGGYWISFLGLIAIVMISFVLGYLIKQPHQEDTTCALDIHFRCKFS